MRVCIPTETKDGLEAMVYGHFGSAPYFTIYDTEKRSLETIDNSNQHHSHGVCHPMGALAGQKVDIVLCGGMGGLAVQKLNEAGIRAFRAKPGSVEEMVGQFKAGQLDEITVENACAQHGCH